MAESNGEIRSIARSDLTFKLPKSEASRPGTPQIIRPRQAIDVNSHNRLKRAVSPVSLTEAAELAGHQGSRKRRMISTGKASPSTLRPEPSTRKASHSRLNLVQTSAPITPQIKDKSTAFAKKSKAWVSRTPQEYDVEDAESTKTSSTFEAENENDEEHQILSPASPFTRSMSLHEEDLPDLDVPGQSEVQTQWQDLGIGSAMTPRVDNETEENFSGFRQPERPRPNILDTAAAQDASLPSPSLSPVTAAANMQSRRGYFETPNFRRPSPTPGAILTTDNVQSLSFTSQNGTSSKDFSQSTQGTEDSDMPGLSLLPTDTQKPGCSLMSIPSMVDTFEAMPEEMKSYLIYQYLRRCPKPVLQFVAHVVNPALKCDFLGLLPVELCLNILVHLDAKTLCRAAQVSKRWRRLIDSSEKIWKRLFDNDKYVLPEGELPRAVREGWGWQYASQSSEFEMDLSALAISPSDTDFSISSLIQAHDPSMNSAFAASQSSSNMLHTKRTKRKAKSKSKSLSRQRRSLAQSASNDEDQALDGALLDMSSADGPYAAASVAAARVSNPNIGLSSLQNLHLFKSIYMRHHIIRKTWMADDVSPRHLAFRAHQRHVVTCLQFDSDKILTGSDDANINVYDTQTGALRAKLEGHEGGVWALQYEGNVLVSGSTDRTVRVWDIEKGRCTHIFQGHTSTVRCLQILMPTLVGRTKDDRSIMMPKQPLIITGSRDSNLRVWKLPKPGDPEFFQGGPAADEGAESSCYVRTLTGHNHSVRAIAAHADTLVSGSYDCSVRVWKISTGETVHRLTGHGQKVYSVVLDTRRNRCISGSMDNLVKVWSLETGSILFNLEGHSSLVGLLDLQQDRLVSAAADSTLRIWDPENGLCRNTLSAHTGAITCFQHDGQKVISGSDRTLKMWNVTTGVYAKDLLTDLSGVWQVKFDERRCVAAVQRNNLTYIEVISHESM